MDEQHLEARDLRVLIVDDDPVDRLYCTTCLKRAEQRYEIHEADSGAAALAALETDSFDCMLLDQNLPDATGIDLLKQLNKGHRFDGMAVIILTGQDTVEVAAQALRGGAADYVQKRSVSTESLGRAIGNATEKVRLEQAIFQERETLAQKNDLLRAKHREIQNFYHQVSHELRTPLTSLREFVSIVYDGLATDYDEQQEYLSYAMESCDRLSSLVEDLIDATRLESGKLRLKVDWVETPDVLVLLERTMGAIAREAEIEVCYAVENGLPKIWADKERVLQILTILMTNALKFTEMGGRVSVSAKSCELDGTAMVRLAVTDTGCGIAKEHQEAVFSRLFQVQKVENEASVGLGLGLSIAKELVESHHGLIGVKSELGKGSEFYVCLPVEEFEVAPDEGDDDGEQYLFDDAA
ncbi:MAG: sensor histidine kinase [Granulosicoccaceae bacterium]